MLQTLFDHPQLFFGYVIALLSAISIHEFAHAITADRLGDPTPRLQKRITLDPRAHIDLYGILFLFIAGFGWGKPVQFDPYNLKHPQKDAAIISIAGPISNFIVVILSSVLLRISYALLADSPVHYLATIILVPMIAVNLMLGVFNLIPIHPLDGFKIVGGLLPKERAARWNETARYGFILLILLLIPFGGSSLINNVMGPVLDPLYKFFLPEYLLQI